MEQTPYNLVPAIDRAIQILHMYRSGDERFGVSELSKLLDLNKSTVFDILHTLAYHNFLEREETTKKYRLGPALFHLGNRAGTRLSVRDVAHPFVLDLAAEFASTAILCTFTPNQRVMIVDCAEPELDINLSFSVGSRFDHWAGVFGKIFHAAMSEQELRSLLARKPIRPLTRNTIVDFNLYRQELEAVRQNGYATDHGEFLDGACAVGVPINDQEGRVSAALIVTGFSRIMNETRMARLQEALPAVGWRISELLGVTAYPCWQGTWAQ